MDRKKGRIKRGRRINGIEGVWNRVNGIRVKMGVGINAIRKSLL